MFVDLGTGRHEATRAALVRLQLVAWAHSGRRRHQHGARTAARQAEDRARVAREPERTEKGSYNDAPRISCAQTDCRPQGVAWRE